MPPFPGRPRTSPTPEAAIEAHIETGADLIAADDVLLFVNAAITSTGQREFHSGADEQSLSLDFLHRYLLGNYRDLYAATLALDVNDHNAALIARNLLVTTGGGPGAASGRGAPDRPEARPAATAPGVQAVSRAAPRQGQQPAHQGDHA